MTCRHVRGDPSCGSYPDYLAELEQERLAKVGKAYEERKEELDGRSPNPDDYEVLDVHTTESNLVMKVKYSGCPKCSFDSEKVMVFLNTNLKEAIKWLRIDPHFDDKPRANREAPSPAARFPATADGWADAISYALGKDETKSL